MAEQNSPRWVERIEVRRENGQGSLKFDGVEFPYAIVNLQINSTSIDAWPSVTLTIEANQLEVFNSLIAKPKSAAC